MGLGPFSRRRFGALALAALASLATKSVPATIAGPASGRGASPADNISASGYCPDSQEARFLSFINAHRKANGVGPLKISRTLGAAADHHSTEMAKNNYFSHTMLKGVSWSANIKNHGYKASGAIGENIAAGNSSAEATFNQWKKSSGHNKNMLNRNFTAIGIGRARNSSSRYGWYWTTTFGGKFDSGPSC
jgi:uncharacterized protein YkwD